MSRQNYYKKVKREAENLLNLVLGNSESAPNRENIKSKDINISENELLKEVVHLEPELNTNEDYSPEKEAEIFSEDEDSLNNLEESTNTENLKDFLLHWSVKHNITTAALNELLQKLHTIDNTLPKDYRTLKETPRSTELFLMGGGTYLQYGLKNCLTDLCELNQIEMTCDELTLVFGIDGLPLFKSNNTHLWPILMSAVGFADVFLVGCYVNKKNFHHLEIVFPQSHMIQIFFLLIL